MKNLAEMLSVGVVDRPVVDMTELTAKYEVAVDLSAEDAMSVARASVSFMPPGGGGGGDGNEMQPEGRPILPVLQFFHPSRTWA